MPFHLSSREKLMIAALVGMGYLFVLFKFIILPTVPRIQEAKQSLASASRQKEALDADVSNMDTYKARTESKKLIGDRLGEYLMDSADITDSIEFVEKVARLTEKDISNISIGKPEENTPGKTNGVQPPAANDSVQASQAASNKYYSFKVGFIASLTLEEALDMIKYCEGGSRKIRISSLKMNPVGKDAGSGNNSNQPQQAFKPVSGSPAQAGQAAAQSAPKDSNAKYNVSMALEFFALKQESLEKLYQFSKARFQRYRNKDGAPLLTPDAGALAGKAVPPLASTEKEGGPAAFAADINIFHKGYLVAGYNYEMNSVFKPADWIRMKTRDRLRVNFVIHPEGYSVAVAGEEGTENHLTGPMPERPLQIYVESLINNSVKENEKMALDIRIENHSGRNIHLRMKQEGGRVRLTDREGNVIFIRNEKEQVYIL